MRHVLDLGGDCLPLGRVFGQHQQAIVRRQIDRDHKGLGAFRNDLEQNPAAWSSSARRHNATMSFAVSSRSVRPLMNAFASVSSETSGTAMSGDRVNRSLNFELATSRRRSASNIAQTVRHRVESGIERHIFVAQRFSERASALVRGGERQQVAIDRERDRNIGHNVKKDERTDHPVMKFRRRKQSERHRHAERHKLHDHEFRTACIPRHVTRREARYPLRS